MQYIPQVTPVGVLRGRDAIYLDRVVVGDACSLIELFGGFNCRLATVRQDRFLMYRIKFDGLLAVRITELDAWGSDAANDFASSFDEVLNSEWKESISGPQSTVTPEHKHYIFQTYDHVFDIVARSYELAIDEE